MPNDKNTSSTENRNTIIQKEIEYLQKQFPWKSQQEIASIFSETGNIDREALKKVTAVHIPAKAPGY